MRVILSEQLKKFRKMSNFTQEELAYRCGVSRQAIAKWENGESLPDVYKLSKLAKMFEVPMEELLYGEEAYNNLYKKLKVINQPKVQEMNIHLDGNLELRIVDEKLK